MDQLSTRKRPNSPTPDDARGEMHLYGRAMDRSALLDREEERALALEIEERAHALWTTLLSHPGSAGPAARLAAERLPSAAAILRPVEHAASEAARSELGREPSNQELADAAGVDVDKLERIQQASQPGEVRLDELIGEDEGRPRGDIFVHPTAELDPEEALHRQGLSRLAEEQLQALSETERDVLRRRFGLGDADEEATLREIGRDYGLSRERIRQIEDGALRKLRARLGAHA